MQRAASGGPPPGGAAAAAPATLTDETRRTTRQLLLQALQGAVCCRGLAAGTVEGLAAAVDAEVVAALAAAAPDGTVLRAAYTQVMRQRVQR